MKELLDKWSLVHFAFFFAISPALMMFFKSNTIRWIAIPLMIVAWELLETGLEHYNIIDGREIFWDRWVSDPIVGLAGALLGGWLIR